MATRIADDDIRDAREERRTHLCLAAVLDSGGLRSSVRIRDLSRDGARIEVSPSPLLGTKVSLIRGPLSASGDIVWRDRERCGIRFGTAIALHRWLPGGEPMRTQDDVDRVVRQFRREQGAESVPSNAIALSPRIADELAFVVRMVETLQAAVAAEPQMIAKHGDKLGLFPEALTTLRLLGDIMRAEVPLDAVRLLAGTGLGRRLLRQSI